MSVAIITGKGQTFHSPHSGKNVHPSERIELVASTNGDVARLRGASFFRPGTQGVTFQSGPAGNCVVAYTNDDPEFALDPANDAAVSWNAWQTINANAAQTLLSPFTVAKITFTAANRIVISSM